MFEREPETKEEAIAALASVEGHVIYQRLGAIVGDVRLDAAGGYVVNGECTLADVDLMNARTAGELTRAKEKIAEDPKLTEERTR
jgi:hypothetical protein